ncbi:MAG: F0F1 ATP synthase subunit alpha, partial [Actinobacteria bacterium]|nr:F0F1 ATP synthase subunit alpha [Actinomycetota bacterium]
QIFLESDLFFSGVRPAINVGISVSRVGGNAQIKAMKQVAGRLRLDLAQYRELEAFAEFGSDLDKASQAQLDRGYRLTELLKQGLNSPMAVEEQVVSLYAGTRGFLDNVPVDDVGRFESELVEWFRSRHSDLLEAIASEGKISDEDAFKKGIEDFAEQFQTSEEADAEEPEPEDQGDERSKKAGGRAEGILPEDEIERDKDGDGDKDKGGEG